MSDVWAWLNFVSVAVLLWGVHHVSYERGYERGRRDVTRAELEAWAVLLQAKGGRDD